MPHYNLPDLEEPIEFDVTYEVIAPAELRRLHVLEDILRKIYAQYHEGNDAGIIFEIQCHEDIFLENIKR